MPRQPLHYPRQYRLRKTDEISSVFDFKCRVSGVNLNAFARPNGLEHARLAIMVAKRISPHAVDRNYMRRVIREVFRAQASKCAPLDIVVRVTKVFNKQQNAEITQELAAIFQKLEKCLSSS